MSAEADMQARARAEKLARGIVAKVADLLRVGGRGTLRAEEVVLAALQGERADEREACARLCDKRATEQDREYFLHAEDGESGDADLHHGDATGARALGRAIRSRGASQPALVPEPVKPNPCGVCGGPPAAIPHDCTRYGVAGKPAQPEPPREKVLVATDGHVERHETCKACRWPMLYRVNAERRPMAMFCGTSMCPQWLIEIPVPGPTQARVSEPPPLLKDLAAELAQLPATERQRRLENGARIVASASSPLAGGASGGSPTICPEAPPPSRPEPPHCMDPDCHGESQCGKTEPDPDLLRALRASLDMRGPDKALQSREEEMCLRHGIYCQGGSGQVVNPVAACRAWDPPKFAADPERRGE